MSPYIRKGKTVSGAMAVQIMTKRQGRQVVLEHLGSAHGEAELAALMAVAHERLYPGQGELELFPARPARSGQITAKQSWWLWQALSAGYSQLGLDVIRDEVFKQLVFARLIEPTSKVDSIRVLKELGIAAPHRNTITACLKRTNTRNYRGILDGLFHSYAINTGGLALCLYDVTTLYFSGRG